MSTYLVGVGVSVLDTAESFVPGAAVLERLKESLRRYAQYHSLKSKSLYQLEHSLELYELHLGRAAEVGDLRSDGVNDWLCSLEKNYSRRTVSGHRANMLTIWRDCADRDVADTPRRVRKIPRPEPRPEAWSIDEVQALLASASELPGRLTNGVSRALYFETFLKVAWSTGLRRSDLMSLKRSEIRRNCIYIRQSKTGHVETWELPADLSAILLSMPGDKPLHWPQATSRYDFWFRRLKKAAGITHGKHAQGMRVSAATDLKKNGATPEQIQMFLGHKDITSQRSYVDKSLARTKKPKPSSLDMPTDPEPPA